MKSKNLFTLFLAASLILTACGGTLASNAPTKTPSAGEATKTPEVSAPTRTPIPAGANMTETPSVPALPGTFDITLTLTNTACGNIGNTVDHPYTFTIYGEYATLLQVDADITTEGTYSASTGEFSTSAVVGPGTEAYSGVITFDGTTITVTGVNSYTQEGQCTWMFDVAGTATP